MVIIIPIIVLASVGGFVAAGREEVVALGEAAAAVAAVGEAAAVEAVGEAAAAAVEAVGEAAAAVGEAAAAVGEAAAVELVHSGAASVDWHFGVQRHALKPLEVHTLLALEFRAFLACSLA